MGHSPRRSHGKIHIRISGRRLCGEGVVGERDAGQSKVVTDGPYAELKDLVTYRERLASEWSLATTVEESLARAYAGDPQSALSVESNPRGRV
jgi:hypothetical protein